MTGHRLRAPETKTLPVRGGSWQASATLTATVVRAVTLNVAEPPQLVPAGVVFADRVIT